ncbi:MAG: S8 family serine peptidase [Phycisphaerales bacterium]|nr:S8 family serine peptidase [Phycisphaerales bacterium]
MSLSAPAQPPSVAFNGRSITLDLSQFDTSGALFLVHVDRALTDDLLQELAQAGIELGPHLGDRVFVARRGGAGASRPRCIDAGAAFPAEFRVDSQLLASADADAQALVPVNVFAWDATPDTLARLKAHAAACGATVSEPATTSRRVVVHAPASRLRDLAHSPEVLWIDGWSAPEPDMHIARAMSGADALESLAGMTGQGVSGEVMDAALLTTHADLVHRPPLMHTANGSDPTHGTPVFGILFGSGATSAPSRGMIPDAQGIFASYNNMTDRAAHTRSLLEAPYRAVFQSNSWGAARSRLYTSVSAELDQIAFDTDVVIFQSQSNAGNQDSRPEAWAKNVVSVGGVVHGNTATLIDDGWMQQASCGPAIDGRIKPDLAHIYEDVWTIASSSNTAHENFWGTSAATPITAGCGALAIQMYAGGLFGNATSGGDVFDARPHAATTKAMLINSARQWNFASMADDLGRFRQGWGHASVSRLYDQRERMLIVDQTDLLAPGQSRVYVADVEPMQDVLQVTLVYPDPPGMPGSLAQLVNDLSLRVTSPDGLVFLGNYGLLDSPYSQAGGRFDRQNTVEQVIVPKPVPGRWTIEVVADEFTADGYPATPQLDATYALVASGVVPRPTEVQISAPAGVPQRRAPYVSMPLAFRVDAVGSPVQVVSLVWRTDGGLSGELTPFDVDDTTYSFRLPAAGCGQTSEVALRVEQADGQVTWWPQAWPASGLGIETGMERTLFTQVFTGSSGWTSSATPGLTGGGWNFGTPLGGGLRGDPPNDADGSGKAWLTNRAAGDTDVDGGSAILTSARIDLSGVPDPLITFAYWLNCDDAGQPGEDFLSVEISADDGVTWLPAATLRSGFAWRDHTLDAAWLVGPVSSVRLRFTIADEPNDSVTEAGVDYVRVLSRSCQLACPGDLNADGAVDFFDVQFFLNAFAARQLAADLNSDGQFNFFDVQTFLNFFAAACP